MKLTALQIAAMLGFDVKVWQSFETINGKVTSKLDESKLGLRRGAHVPQDRYLSQLTVFCKVTGLSLIGDITKGKMFYWVALDKAAFDAIALEGLNLPVTLTIVEVPAPKAARRKRSSAARSFRSPTCCPLWRADPMSLQSRAAQADLLQELLSDEQSNECQELQDEAGGALGDPRRCRRHPNVVTSSPDGMFDAPCGACEAAMESGE